jgi:hypothetical protein
MIVNENNLRKYIQNYIFLDKSFKNTLLKYFDKIDDIQIIWLIDYFNNQKRDILEFLKSFKNKEVCSFENIKSQIENKSRLKIRQEEKQEIENEQDEFLNLVNAIDNL